jgi:hypothetical protein
MNNSYENIERLSRSLIGAEVTVSVSDPWEFGSEHGNNPIPSVIEQCFIRFHGNVGKAVGVEEALLIRVQKPFGYKKIKFEYLLASPRHVGKGLHNLNSGESVPFNFLRIPEAGAKEDPFQAENQWRGGPEGLIGSLTKLK